MSMELLVVLSLLNAPDQEKWQTAIDNLDMPIKIIETVDLQKLNGFLPISIGETNTGLYFNIVESDDITSEFKEKLTKTDISDSVIYSLGYGGHFYESAAVFYSAAALVSTFGGIAYEPQGDIFMGFDELIEAAKISHEFAMTEQ